MILLWKLDHIKSLSLRKRGWETLVYRVADLCGGQARVVAPDELSDHAVAAAAVASPSSDYTRRMQCTRWPLEDRTVLPSARKREIPAMCK